MDIYDIQAFGDLEVNKEYIVELRNSEIEDDYIHIRILYKNEDVCLYEIIDPNSEKSIKKWTTTSEDGELISVYSDVSDYSRSKKIDSLVGEEKQ